MCGGVDEKDSVHYGRIAVMTVAATIVLFQFHQHLYVVFQSDIS